MKIHFLLLFVFMVGAVYISCTNKSSRSLIGTWMLTSEEITDCDDLGQNYQENIPCSDSICFKITFGRSGKMKVDVTLGGATNSWEETYSVKGDKISICSSSGCRSRGSFTIRDTQLMFADTLEQGCLKREYYQLVAGR